VNPPPAIPRRVGAAVSARLHAFRTQDELDAGIGAELARLLPGVDAALCLADDVAGRCEVRVAIGTNCPLRGRRHARVDDWSVPASQRMVVPYGPRVLGELLLGAPTDNALRADLEELLVHYGTALANLVLHAESRQATQDYCASLQALEEGIVLFQEEDPAAVMARVLALVAGMVRATAGALYVLREVGRLDSGLRLEQAIGIPESLLESLRGVGGASWPDALLDQQAHVAVREAGGAMASLDPGCVPAALREVVVLPLRYHGVQAGVCLLFNPSHETVQQPELLHRLQSFARLAAALLHRLSLQALTANSVSIARELEIAETIQKRLLPSVSPRTDEYEFAWSTIAAKHIGGDYLDVLASDLGDLYVIVADASGHGINSALLMTSFRANYRGNAPWLEPHDLAASLNREVVHEVGPTGMFITAMLLRFERETRRLSWCSAGHNATMWWRADRGTLESLSSGGPPLGFLERVEYEPGEATVAAGDVLLLYTDGITEATNADLEMFGDERLAAVLRDHIAAPAEAVLAAVHTALAAFTGRERYEDDASMVVVKVR
jgi:serine phosphatase RsbU (regulator of sigma subunit)